MRVGTDEMKVSEGWLIASSKPWGICESLHPPNLYRTIAGDGVQKTEEEKESKGKLERFPVKRQVEIKAVAHLVELGKGRFGA